MNCEACGIHLQDWAYCEHYGRFCSVNCKNKQYNQLLVEVGVFDR